MSWIYLTIAGIFEIAWAVGIKYTEGWSKFWPSAFTIISMIAGFYFLSMALKELPIGTAYAVWTGIGTIGVAIYGIIFFQESSDILRILCIVVIVTGIVGLRILSTNHS
jgi:quaternary ammonium compound-resistance protein SugE